MQLIMDYFKALNPLDIIIVITVLVCVSAGYQKGLIKSVFDLFSSIIAIILAQSFYPIVANTLKQNSAITGYLRQIVINGLNIKGFIEEQTVYAQKQFIESLPAPGSLTEKLLSNNNSEVYRFFNVNTVEEYVTNYILNIFINFISVIIVFILVGFILKIFGKSLRIIKKLPIIGFIDRIGGGACGFVTATILIWFFFIIATIFFMQPFFAEVLKSAENSSIANFFYKNNLIMDMIYQIST